MMLGKLKSKAVRLFGPLGGYQVVKFLVSQSPRILMYHRFGQETSAGKVGVAEFEMQVKLLKEKFNVLPLSQLSNILNSGEKLPSHAISLTIDDGYEDFYHYAYPILKKYDVPATVYASSDFIDKKMWMWPDIIEYALSQTLLLEYTLPDGSVIKIDTEDNKQQVWRMIADYCLSIPDTDKRIYLQQVAETLNVDIPTEPVNGFTALSWEQMKEMMGNGINIGAHTCSHPSLGRVDIADLKHEIFDCKARIEEMLGNHVDCFCYPNGTRSDYTETVKQFVEEAGYTNATVAFFDQYLKNDMYELRRFGVSGDMFQFKKSVYGVEYLSTKLPL